MQLQRSINIFLCSLFGWKFAISMGRARTTICSAAKMDCRARGSKRRTGPLGGNQLPGGRVTNADNSMETSNRYYTSSTYSYIFRRNVGARCTQRSSTSNGKTSSKCHPFSPFLPFAHPMALRMQRRAIGRVPRFELLQSRRHYNVCKWNALHTNGEPGTRRILFVSGQKRDWSRLEQIDSANGAR